MKGSLTMTITLARSILAFLLCIFHGIFVAPPIYDLTDDDPSPIPSQITNAKKMKRRGEDTFWHASQQTPPPPEFTPGKTRFRL